MAVIAAGERWPGTSAMRPCFEDLVGAGAILSGFDLHECSPEAVAEIGAFAAVADRVREAVTLHTGGRELFAWGFEDDVTVATELNVAPIVAILSQDGYFTAER